MNLFAKGKGYAEEYGLPYLAFYLCTFVICMIISGLFFIPEYGLHTGLGAAYVFTKALTPLRIGIAIAATYAFTRV
tara:strand:+ start:5784 stop:6011 length:228 start_codon:yes stop_codon:yes gene_type:complete